MMLEPFNKANCHALLNTLFPPVTTATTQPTTHLTPTILQAHRDGFFRYIKAVEANGKKILTAAMQHGARNGEETAWPAVRDVLDKYLRVANDIINECYEVNGRDALDQKWGHKRSTDSGISFTSSDRPPLANATSTTYGGSAQQTPPPNSNAKTSKSSGSTLERIAKEIRKMRSRPEVKGNSKDKTKAKGSYKKTKSHAALGVHRASPSSDSSIDEPFDVEEFKRNRLIWAAHQRKEGQQ
jgi:hypothetical protein